MYSVHDLGDGCEVRRWRYDTETGLCRILFRARVADLEGARACVPEGFSSREREMTDPQSVVEWWVEER